MIGSMSAAMVRREKVIFLLDNTTCDGKRRKEDCWRQKPYTRKAVKLKLKARANDSEESVRAKSESTIGTRHMHIGIGDTTVSQPDNIRASFESFEILNFDLFLHFFYVCSSSTRSFILLT